MEKSSGNRANWMFWSIVSFLRSCLFLVISARPIPHHIAFIMDGNRRYAKKRKLMEGTGHRVGFVALMSMLKYCYELGVRYVTIYAFSIENFKRQPEEVQSLMDLMQEKIEGLIKEESIVNRYGVKVHFIGNLKLLTEPVRLAAERAMVATANNSRGVLSICLAYTSTDEIVHAVQESCEEKWDEISILNTSGTGYGLVNLEENEKDVKENIVKLTDIERHMYMAVAPDPDILIRTSGCVVHMSAVVNSESFIENSRAYCQASSKTTCYTGLRDIYANPVVRFCPTRDIESLTDAYSWRWLLAKLDC